MCREQGNRKSAESINPCINGVSGALWPVDIRRYVATNCFAQWRRSFIMKELEWLYIQRCVIQILHALRPLFLFVLLGGGVILAISVLQYWLLLLLLAALWSILIVLTTRLMLDKLYSIIMNRLHMSHYSRRLQTRFLAASPQFPETPMPATPLIRVLETIDLSTMDVEHFIADTSQIEITAQTPLPQSSGSTI